MAKVDAIIPVTVEVKFIPEFAELIRNLSEAVTDLRQRVATLEERNDWYGDGR